MKKYFNIFVLVMGMIFLFSSVVAAQNMIQIKGSDTLINLVQTLAEAYMAKNSGKMIAVTGGGSGTGIAALINGKCDIADASRAMKDKEKKLANSRGVDPGEVIIAMDGLSVIINQDNPVDKMTLDQLGAIFRGEITNWKYVGGHDKPITLYGRQSNSGTFVFFGENVVKGDYSQKMNRMNGNAQIVESVKRDVSGIGYVGVGYAKDATGITVVKVAAQAGADYASPLNTADVKSGKYPIARPLYQYINGTPKGAVKDFIAFELSSEGQNIVEREGFFRVSSKDMVVSKRNAGL